MSEIIGIIFLAILTGFCLTAYFTVLYALFPSRIAQTSLAVESSPTRAFFLGMVNFLFFGVICLFFFALGERIHPVFALPGLFILLLTGIALSMGLGGIVQLTGNRLFLEKSLLVRTTWGTSALYLACLTPFVGWFGLTIYISLLGIGAFILSFFKPKGSPGAKEE